MVTGSSEDSGLLSIYVRNGKAKDIQQSIEQTFEFALYFIFILCYNQFKLYFRYILEGSKSQAIKKLINKEEFKR